MPFRKTLRRALGAKASEDVSGSDQDSPELARIETNQTTTTVASNTSNTSSSPGIVWGPGGIGSSPLRVEDITYPKPKVYKRGEKMPKPRYKGDPEPKVGKMLEAFSFGDAWNRRRSMDQHSTISPGHSRGPSRKASIAEGQVHTLTEPTTAYPGQLIENAASRGDLTNVGMSRDQSKADDLITNGDEESEKGLNGDTKADADSSSEEFGFKAELEDALEKIDINAPLTSAPVSV